MKHVPAVALPLLFAAATLFGQMSTSYELRFDNAAHHEASVRATFTGVPPGPLTIYMSRSSPGRYSLHEFAKNVYGVQAADEQGRPLPLDRPDPYGWTVSGHRGTVVFTYTVFGDEVDGTYVGIDTSHAHLNLPGTLAWARGFEHSPYSIRFLLPAQSGWRVATELPRDSAGVWTAPDLERLMDGPVELSAHAEPQWKIGDAGFRLALHGGGNEAQANAFAAMCRRVVLEEGGVFGKLPPFDNGTYTFLLDYLPWADFDGMEHRDSTVITGHVNLSKDWNRAIGTIAHEFFHAWNVRRIRPRSLEPFDFERADMSGELWFAEGFTNYYGMLALARAGFSPLDDFSQRMGRAVNMVLNAPGRNVHNVVDMSRLAPFVDAAKSVDPTNFTNTSISYYTYGQALAFGIDLSIRERYPGKSLDDWMRTMWREHPDVDRPYELADLERTLGETVGDERFAHEIFEKHIYGREPLPYGALVAPAGLVLRKEHAGAAWLGAAKLDYTPDGVSLAGPAITGAPLYAAGLDSGDRVQRWDGKTLKTSAELESWLKHHQPGERVPLTVERRGGQVQTAELILGEDPALEIVPFEKAAQTVTPAIAAFRKDWLASRALEPLGPMPVMP